MPDSSSFAERAIPASLPVSARTAGTPPLLVLELNEVNFEQVQYYIGQGRLPAFKSFLERHGYAQTTSEAEYEQLEPWIQWVTAHTGLTLKEHGVFRLGDIVNTDIPQIWERLEGLGHKVGAVSPMNAKYRLAHPAFFVPDPWTRTDLVGAPSLRRLYDAIAELVNENASSRPSARALLNLAIGSLLYSRPKNWIRYLGLVLSARSRPWARALFLDLLLSDVFVRSVRKTKPDFSTIFLNAAAHIQHHYMYSSPSYEGDVTNPDWYLPAGADPLFDVYKLYDDILGDIQESLPGARLMLATGLHQDPHGSLTFYWRLRSHDAFLRGLGLEFVRVEPRMSRDFLLVCRDDKEAETAAKLMNATRTSDGKALFDVDNRGSDLFVMLIRDEDIANDLIFTCGNRDMGPLKAHVAFVAIKNGQHNGVGYFADSNAALSDLQPSFPLAQLPDRMLAALGHGDQTMVARA